MAWLYHWLFEVCTDAPAVTLPGHFTLQLTCPNHGPVYNVLNPTWIVPICPTITLHVVLLLSLLGMLAGVAIVSYGLVRVKRAVFSSTVQPSVGRLVGETYQELEDASWEYLRRRRR
ncbi:MAG: hypothetical protein H0U76_08890 [Ktedonobacteraceae bacterium]|nr:hypothetical protein [Ktedonobacteraceae bacterium]